jgi:hypothetical protein
MSGGSHFGGSHSATRSVTCWSTCCTCTRGSHIGGSYSGTRRVGTLDTCSTRRMECLDTCSTRRMECLDTCSTRGSNCTRRGGTRRVGHSGIRRVGTHSGTSRKPCWIIRVETRRRRMEWLDTCSTRGSNCTRRGGTRRVGHSGTRRVDRSGNCRSTCSTRTWHSIPYRYGMPGYVHTESSAALRVVLCFASDQRMA